MSKEIPSVEDEIVEHKEVLEKWMEDVSNLPVPNNQKGVTGRFVSDCKSMIGYLEEKESPSTADLNDFTARRNSLNIQYQKLMG